MSRGRIGDKKSRLFHFSDILRLFKESTLLTCILWIFSAVIYLLTLAWCDGRADANTISGQRNIELEDLGFAIIPHANCFVYVSDGVALCLGFWTMWALFAGKPAQRNAARYVLFAVSIGNIFSTSLHSFTLLPSTKEFGRTDLPLMGGQTDKLMSNHTFNIGLVLQMYVKLGYFPAWVVPVGVFIYSVMMVSTRAHYTVDMILAWWALAVANGFSDF